MFLKCCKNENQPSTTAWFYLGLSCLRLGEYTHAEDALTQANILDHLNPRVWGLMAVLCLQPGPKDRKVQAKLCFKEALKLKLSDSEILEELGDLYSKDDDSSSTDLAIESYSELVRLNPQAGEVW